MKPADKKRLSRHIQDSTTLAGPARRKVTEAQASVLFARDPISSKHTAKFEMLIPLTEGREQVELDWLRDVFERVCKSYPGTVVKGEIVR